MCRELQANEELRQKLSSPHPQNLISPTNHLRDVSVHEPSQDHHWVVSSQDEPGSQCAECSQEEPDHPELSPNRQPVESCQDQLIQQLVRYSPPDREWVESSRDQLVQQWMESSSDNHIKYYPPVKSPV